MKVHPIWDNFSLGEVSPRLWHREGVADKALAKLRNMIITSQGSAKRRGGFRFIGGKWNKTTSDGSSSMFHRVFWFPINNNLGFIINFNKGKTDGFLNLTFNTVHGPVDGGGDATFTNPHFSSGVPAQIAFWEFTGLGSQKPGVATLISDSNSSNPDSTVSNASIWTHINIESYYDVIVDVEMPDGNMEYTVNLSNNEGLNDTFTVNHAGRFLKRYLPPSLPSVTANYTITVTVASGQIVDGNDSPRLFIKQIQVATPLVTPTDAYDRIEKTFNVIEKEDAESLQAVPVPGENQVWIVGRSTSPIKVSYSSDYHTFSVSDLPFLTAAPAEWADDNYPTTITFFQGRSWFGGCELTPERFWASRSDDITNLTLGTGADDAFQFDIAKKGKLQWFLGLKNLLMGSSSTEFYGTSADGVLTVSDIQIDPQSANGSRHIQALEVANTAIYVSGNGSKIRTSFWRWEENAWKSKDVTFLAEHAFSDGGIKRLAYQNHPEKILWAVKYDGSLWGASFDDSLEFVAWHKHETSGKILDICVSSEGGVQNLIVAIDVTYQFTDQDDGVGVGNSTILCKMDDICKMDFSSLSSFTTEISPYGSSILGNSNSKINGTESNDLSQAVSITDETVDSSFTTVVGTTTKEGIIEMGVDFSCSMKTLPMDFATQAGSSPSWKKRWNQIYARLISGYPYPKINGERPDEAEYVVDEDIGVEDVRVTNLGDDLHAIIEIEQDLPYDLEVSGIFGEMVQNRL